MGRRRGRLRRAINDLTGLLVATRRIAAQTRQRCPASFRTGRLAADWARMITARGRNIGVVAVARRLLTLVYYGLRDGEIRTLARGAG